MSELYLIGTIFIEVCEKIESVADQCIGFWRVPGGGIWALNDWNKNPGILL